MRIIFSDGEKIGVFKDGKKEYYESNYLKNYRENAIRSAKNKEWKKSTDLMMEEGFFFGEEEVRVRAKITSVAPDTKENRFVYAFNVNETSGIYYKHTDDKEKTEEHIVTSAELEFFSLFITTDGEMLGAVKNTPYNAKIVVFHKENGDFEYMTDGDSLDENPSFDGEKNILFNSYAVGRDENNVFITYLPSAIYKLDTGTLELEEVLVDEKFSYIKPVMNQKGELYCIKKPGVEKEEGNAFLDILLIPVRIVQAIVGFISAFVTCFARKPMISGGSAQSIGNGGELARSGDGKKMMIHNQTLNIEKELKRNRKYDGGGFIPRSWKLVKIVFDSKDNFKKFTEYELALGVADFSIATETEKKTELVYTNGKHVFKVSDHGETGKRTKLFDTDFCLHVNCIG